MKCVKIVINIYLSLFLIKERKQSITTDNRPTNERDNAPELGEIIRQVEIPLGPELRRAVADSFLPQLEQMRDLTLREGRECALLHGVQPDTYSHTVKPTSSRIVLGQEGQIDRKVIEGLFTAMGFAGEIPLVLAHTHPNGPADFSSLDKTTWTKPVGTKVFMEDDVWEALGWRPIFCVLGVSHLDEENMVVFLTQHQEQIDADELMTHDILHRLKIIMDLTAPNPQFSPEMEAKAAKIEEEMGDDGEVGEGDGEDLISPEEAERFWDETRQWLQEIGFTLQRFRLSNAEGIVGYLADHLPEKVVLTQRKEKHLPSPDLSFLVKKR
ncbi:hypothetical protein CO015_02145 [candidate division WWE3 bacterium CG_4_8_14_3_um_filter_42_11]|uniref:JAB domain-containing protein n=1 Tax=candidate division WWE3 bacterium CG_4_8_14_3_um_filter_42_11 TaxID=1975076 RepID=A0A2M8G7E5_UNCKA|nr:MAG: hypothetical protein CO015_02145 [candidate division WWE3 bacterium CG_4_8_14_3_um_filter_42_11]